MNANRKTAGALAALLGCAVPIAIAAAISFWQPRTVIRLHRTDHTSHASATLRREWLYMIPLSVEQLGHVQRTQAIRTDAQMWEIHLFGGDRSLSFVTDNDGPYLEGQIREFLGDRSRSTYHASADPAIPLVLFFGVLGSALTLACVAGWVQHRYFPRARKRFRDQHVRATLQSDSPEGIPADVWEAIRDEYPLTSITQWQPGTRIVIDRTLTMPVYLVMWGIGALVGSLLGHWLLGPVAVPAGLLLGMLAMSYFIAVRRLRWRVTLDWQRNRVKWGGLLWTRRASLQKITHLLVRPIYHGIDGRREFRAELTMKLGGAEVILFDTLSWDASANSITKRLYPLAAALGKALKVSYSRTRTPASRWQPRASLRSLLVWLPVICLIVVAIAAGSYLAAGASRHRRLEALGIRVERMSEYSIGGSTVFRNGYVANVAAEVDDECLAASVADLRAYSRLRLVLDESQVGDRGLRSLRDMQNVVALEIRQTPVTDAAMSVVASIPNLVALNLDETKLTDAGLRQLAPLAKLRFLTLAKTKVTDQGLATLRSHRFLDRLVVGWGMVTPEGVDDLRFAMPGTEIVRVGPPYDDPLRDERVTRQSGDTLSADGGPLIPLLSQYFAAIHAGDFYTAKSLWSESVTVSFHDYPQEALEIRPTHIVDFEGFIGDGAATVVVTGPTPNGDTVRYQVQLVKEGEEWKLSDLRMVF